MSYFEDQQENTLMDTCLDINQEAIIPSLRRQNSSEKYVDMSEPLTQIPKSNRTTIKPSKSQQKPHQSNLHNCPKHLIKLVFQCLGLGKNTSEEISEQFKIQGEEVYQNIKNLLGILEMVRRGKLRSFSKQLLKIIFQNSSEDLPRLKLLQNPLVSKIFAESDAKSMCMAKDVLREYTISRLVKNGNNFNDRSKKEKKDVNSKYLQLFLQELKMGRIKQRISRQDKNRIFQ